MVVPNKNNKLVPMSSVTGWRVCMDYRKLNSWTEKDHFSMLFMDQILDRLADRGWYCFLDGYSGYNQICITLEDQEKTTFTFSMEHLLSSVCPLDYTTRRPYSNDACYPFLLIW